MRTAHSRLWGMFAAFLALLVAAKASPTTSGEPTVDELKNQIASAKIVDRPPLCLRLSERQLATADQFYIAGDSDHAKAALGDVVQFSELARDYAIQAHRHEKESEITIRRMVHKLNDLKRSVTREDQEEVQTTLERLQKVRDDLLAAMFPKAVKK